MSGPSRETPFSRKIRNLLQTGARLLAEIEVKITALAAADRGFRGRS